MNVKYLALLLIFCGAQILSKAQNEIPVFQSMDFRIFGNRVEQGNFTATAVSPTEMTSNYRSLEYHEKQTAAQWKLSRDISEFPQYTSDYPVSDAIYNLALEEMMRAVEPDSTFRTGKEWAGVWTRDISYSIILAMAQLQPRVAKYSLLRKVKDGRIIQDTGTGGAYPASTDRMIWAVAAWELYKTTGDRDWLHQAYAIIRNSVDDDMSNAYDAQTGLVRGESSFLDWREQTYPKWMQPADIYGSENLGTNAVHYQANVVLSCMASLLKEPEAAGKYAANAARIKDAINRYLWMDSKGYYGQYLYGRNFKILSPRSEALGEALCVWFGIAGVQQQKSLMTHTPVMEYGISCIYPQIPGIPPYHNNAVWPFVQSYWALASAKAGAEQSVLESIADVYRPAALFLTNKENFVANNGDFAGTKINSSNMLWSLSGSLALVHKILFGIEFQTDSLVFHPFVPKAFKGKRSLSNFKCRGSVLNIEMEGYGSRIKSFEVDGIPSAAAISYSLTGIHKIRIILDSEDIPGLKINKVSPYVTLPTPSAVYAKGMFMWNRVAGAQTYVVLKNGKELPAVTDTTLKVSASGFAEYQVMALDENRTASFASEPVVVEGENTLKSFEMEQFSPKSQFPCKNFQANGFVEISKTVNTIITIPVQADSAGIYSVCFRYANGNGPVNTENKCAIRTLKVNGNFAGTVVFPQRGTNEWSNWGYSNPVQTKLVKGKNSVTLSFEPQNENMNGDINQAMLDVMYIRRL